MAGRILAAGGAPWCRSRAAKCHLGQRGQSTVEFALVAVVILGLMAALGALTGLMQDGAVPRHALVSASHQVEGGDAGAWDDVLAY